MKRILLSTLGLVLATTLQLRAADSEEGFVSLFDGQTFNGWKPAEEHPQTWHIEDGALVAHGDRCHLFYVGDPKPFKNFELRVDVMTRPGSNGGIYFHTKYQPTDWPRAGFECQVNVTHSDWIKTGSLYGLVNIAQVPVKDNQWWTQTIIVKDRTVTVLLDGKRLFEYVQPLGAQPGKDFARVLDQGTFALQGHDPKSVIYYKNIRVKRLD